MGICRSVLPPEQLEEVLKLPFNPNTFGDRGTVGELHPRRQSALGKVVGQVVGAVLRRKWWVKSWGLTLLTKLAH
jgi:hypothetical protein